LKTLAAFFLLVAEFSGGEMENKFYHYSTTTLS
jgi:hypothetical protein